MTRFQGLGRGEVTVLDELVPLDDHRAEVLSEVAPLDAEETAVDEALGRVLAEDVTAAAPLPGFANSAMDGYAVRTADVSAASVESPAPLEVVGEVAAGGSSTPHVGRGQAARIMTGAPIPSGADTVVPVEVTSQQDTRVHIHRTAEHGEHIRRAGEDVAAGAVVAERGTRVSAVTIALIAAVGRSTVRCHRRARVAVISTGDELVPAGEELGHGQLHDSNGPMLTALARTEGAEATHASRIGDDPEALADALSSTARSADLVLVSGGVSAGAHDHLPDVLATLGMCRRAKVAMKPGMPQLHGRIEGVPVLALPGNPVSSFVSFELFALPVLRALHGRRDLDRPTLVATAAEDLHAPAGKRTFLRVTLETGEAELLARPAGGQGSHVLSALAAADGLAVVPEEVTMVAAGDVVRVRLLTDLL